jgi:hypothetical protein
MTHRSMIREFGMQFILHFLPLYDYNVHSSGLTFRHQCESMIMTIEYSIQGNKSLNIHTVSCLTTDEQEYLDIREVTPKGIFSKMIYFLLGELNNPTFRVILNNVMDSDWFAKLCLSGWEPLFKKQVKSTNFYDYDDTSMQMTMNTCKHVVHVF